jgi:hypothetical protein
MPKDRMTVSSPEYSLMKLKQVYDYARKNTDSDRLTVKDIEAAQQAVMGKKGGGIAIKGMGAAYKKGGMTKARAGKMMNLKMVAKKKKKK